MTAPAFFSAIDKLWRQEQPAAWRHYFRWQLLHHSAARLPKAFVAESFKLAKALTGTPKLAPRWKRCLKATDSALGELLAQPFVRERFAGSAKQGAERLVHAISAAFAALVKQLPWMDAATKQLALEKRRRMAYLIGYPARWRRLPPSPSPRAMPPTPWPRRHTGWRGPSPASARPWTASVGR